MTLRNFLGGVFIIFITVGSVQAALPPDPNALLLSVRQQQAAEQGVLNAQLREKSNSTAFRIVYQGGTIRYEFSNPPQTLFLKLGNQSAEIWERQGNKTSALTASRFDQYVRGTSVTYEDLAFRFLYWPNPVIIGEDNLRTRPAWILQVASPGKSSRYGLVRVWIDKESGALLRMEGFDHQGHSFKRFEVVSAQKVRGRWLLKEMRIEERDPTTGKVVGRAYLTITAK
jgi:Outer membrane lipoprotein-sorting protein